MWSTKPLRYKAWMTKVLDFHYKRLGDMCENGVSPRITPLRCERRRVFLLGGQACSLPGQEIQAIGQEGPEPQAAGDRACAVQAC